LISVVHKVIDLDQKKQINADNVAFNFHIKKVSVYGIKDEIIKEIYKFLYPIQLILVKEACVVMNRLKKKAWKRFQEIFEESSFEVYEYHELIIIEIPRQSKEEKQAENRQLSVNKLTERLHNKYWSVEERSSAKEAEVFVARLE
ncbi:11720_t:CDS:2, partial [Scutellospora calospora]